MSKTIHQLQPFHLAIPVHDLESAKNFYHHSLGCEIGRSSNEWIDFNFFGHQLVCHLSERASNEITNSVDSNDIPVPHFGLVLSWNDFKTRLAGEDMWGFAERAYSEVIGKTFNNAGNNGKWLA